MIYICFLFLFDCYNLHIFGIEKVDCKNIMENLVLVHVQYTVYTQVKPKMRLIYEIAIKVNEKFLGSKIALLSSLCLR